MKNNWDDLQHEIRENLKRIFLLSILPEDEKFFKMAAKYHTNLISSIAEIYPSPVEALKTFDPEEEDSWQIDFRISDEKELDKTFTYLTILHNIKDIDFNEMCFILSMFFMQGEKAWEVEPSGFGRAFDFRISRLRNVIWKLSEKVSFEFYNRISEERKQELSFILD